MFNDFNLKDEEVMKILEDYKPLILKTATLNKGIDEDLIQEINIVVFRKLTRNRKK